MANCRRRLKFRVTPKSESEPRNTHAGQSSNPDRYLYRSGEPGEAEALAQCFAENAIVRDEGKTIEGLAAIRKWMVETKQKYQHTFEPLAATEKDGKTIVTNRLTGDFPGNPIELEFVFTLDRDKIAALEILS